MQKNYAKKSLGQNFLQSESALQKIIEAGDVSSNDFVLEIGPGKGALTKYLLATGAKVFAIETDFEMVKILQEKFDVQIKKGQLVLIRDDILKFDLNSIKEFTAGKYKLIANIPYYITGEIIRKFLSENNYPEKMVLLVQKEVADRIIARDGKESILSIATKVYCKPKFIDTVKAGSFVPAPKVDSAIVLFDHISKKLFLENKIYEQDFFEILKKGFAHKRKKLLSNLKGGFNFDESKVCAELNLDKNIRAENINIKDWIEITKFIKKNSV
jgi:16S rRNA (adenine1518-N6/adenine1519-N6)-dimethyltransferase